MKLVYIYSPLGGEPEKNIAKTSEYAREGAMKGSCAIIPHCVFTQFLNDEMPDEHWPGQGTEKALPRKCDKPLVCGSIISKGMHEGVKIAYENGITVLGKDLSIADIEDAAFGETERCCEMV